MIISLKTENAALLKVFDVPFIGSLVVFLLALAPMPIIAIASTVSESADAFFVIHVNTFITAVWNAILSYVGKITISIIFVPCWILFAIIATLQVFGIVGS